MTQKKVGLAMIVKNEAHVIERCLASVLPIVDHWTIVDTGSTDGTQDVIRKFFEQVGIPGEIHEIPWKNFAYNRTRALQLARDKADYTLMIDADEIMEYEGNFDPFKFRESLTADLYNVWAKFHSVKYHRPQLTCNRLDYEYKGVLHEFVACKDEIKTREFAPGIVNRPIQDGARSKNEKKYADDAITFETALADPEQRPTDVNEYNRYLFYLAQSYRDSGQLDKAIDAYKKRADAGGWNEEVFYSLLQVGVLKTQRGDNIDEILKVHIDAWNVNPWRSESLHSAATLCKNYGRFDQAYRFAKEAVKIRMPEGALFVVEGIYVWGCIEELSVAAFWTERYEECMDACVYLLNCPAVPPAEKPRIQKNFDLARIRLAESKTFAAAQAARLAPIHAKPLPNMTPEQKTT